MRCVRARRLRAAGNRRNAKRWPSRPDAISASTIDDGPTSGTTRKPSRCAASTSAAPGSAIAGQPASDSRPSERFSRSGPAARRSLADLPRSRSPATAGMPSGGQERARGLRVLDDEIARASARSRARKQAARPAALRRAAWEWRRGSKNWQSGALEHLAERDQRQADERARVLGVDARDEGDAQALGLRGGRSSRRAVPFQIALDARSSSVRNVTRQGTTRD